MHLEHRARIFRHKLARMLTFAVVTQVLAAVLAWYARTPFHPTLFAWSLFGLLIGAVEQFFFTGRMARLPVYVQLALRVAITGLAAMVVLTLILLLNAMPPAFDELGIGSVGELWASPLMWRVMTNGLIIAAMVTLFMDMERMVGTRMFRRFLTGRYARPRREDRVVMFMDLVGSTTLTEQLGDRRYFEMLNETFDRMGGAILLNGAEVLKYVGDEVIFIWTATGDARDLRCVDLFYDLARVIDHERAHYQRTYGVVPRFRAGCHRGTVITAQIGSIKRTIDLSGDAMNTCARLAGATKDLDADVLVSDDLLAPLRPLPARYRIAITDRIELKGKALPLEVAVVERV